MRLEQVHLVAFRRFVDVSFYVNRKLVALVGPNEAGKSSVLAAVALFADEDPVSESDMPRTEAGLEATAVVASLTFRLEKDDLAVLKSLPLEQSPSTLTISKRVDGSLTWKINTNLDLSHKARDSAAGALKYVRNALGAVSSNEGLSEELAASLPALNDAVERVATLFLLPEDFTRAEWSQIWTIYGLLSESAMSAAERRGWAALRFYFEQAHELDALGIRFRREMQHRVPDIVTFDRNLREVKDDYDLDAIVAGDAARDLPLDYLLRFADTSVEALFADINDRPRQKNALKRVNKKLKINFQARWKQSDAVAKVDIENHRLFVYVEDTSSDFLAKFSERSDGLRTFVALATFLGATKRDVEPIVLIDEADLHLHIDAQADLIRMLQSFKGITQVLYTTHSPACLPSDLGTGVRLVARKKVDPRTSDVHDSFWASVDSEDFGISPLLYLLGARAASFSRLRYATLTEGESEPFLMPALLRSAHESQLYEVPFQFVSGLSSASDRGLRELEQVAVRVCFLVDGDSGGTALQDRIQEQLKPRPARQKQLPEGMAVEDLMEPAAYLRAYNKVIAASGRQVAASDLASGVPIKKALADWATAKKNFRGAGSIAVAEMLLTDSERSNALLELTPEGRSFLLKLDQELRAELLG